MVWLVEEGIGEHRAIRLENGRIAAARVAWPGELTAGEVIEASLLRRLPGTSTALVRLASGAEALARRMPGPISTGARLWVEITRPAMAERGRLKLAQAVYAKGPAGPPRSLARCLQDEGEAARIVRRFPAEADWEELLDEAWEAQVSFSGGMLLFADTPAMTLIDVDTDDPDSLARHGVPAIAAALRRFDLGGNIGIDFPTLADKADRRVVDGRLDEALAGWPHERTAMNGFGFVQIVARLARPSLLRRIAADPAGAAARRLLRRAEQLDGAGTLELSAHPKVLAALRADWLEELRQRSGRSLRLRPDPGLAPGAPQAQLVPA